MSVPEACSEVHMDKYMMLCIAFAIIALALSVCVYVQKISTSRHLNRLDQMLEAAMDDCPHPGRLYEGHIGSGNSIFCIPSPAALKSTRKD